MNQQPLLAVRQKLIHIFTCQNTVYAHHRAGTVTSFKRTFVNAFTVFKVVQRCVNVSARVRSHTEKGEIVLRIPAELPEPLELRLWVVVVIRSGENLP